jgi:hypothetical protein
MSLNIEIISALLYLIPEEAEIYYHHTLNSGNMTSNGIYLDIINKRNFLYTCGLSSIFLLFTPFKILRTFTYCLFLYSVSAYFCSVKKWHTCIYSKLSVKII